jgi:flavin-dependent dehydrogenase
MQKKVVIVGGGTAGWIAASLLNHYLNQQDKSAPSWQVTLIESPEIGIIGVGEGSTPQLKRLFDELNIHESEWMQACSATYKNGISFIDWTEHTASNRYFHPFPSPFDRQTAAAFLYHNKLRRQGMDVPVDPKLFFLSAYLAEHDISPKTDIGKPQIPLNYAYHFDSAKLGNFLVKKAKASGVQHIQGKIGNDESAIHFHDNGNIKTLELDTGALISADLFLDCTGFQSLLLQKALGVKFESFSNNLFNDRAIAIPSERLSPIPSETKATALSAGWAWQIPLQNRTGNGYVYSSKYLSAETAERELFDHVFKQESLSSSRFDELKSQAKYLHMNVGQVEKHWHKNVVALGLSQGFIEPLEATALHLVHETILKLKNVLVSEQYKQHQEYPQGDYLKSLQTDFNDDIRSRFDGVRDYIVCHYKMNTRTDSQYWIDNRNNTDISDKLAAVLDAWQSEKDIVDILEKQKMTSYYPVISWYCLLAGYGAYKPASSENRLPAHQLKQLRAFIENAAQNFIPHEDVFGK